MTGIMELSKKHSQSVPSIRQYLEKDSSLFSSFISKQSRLIRSQICIEIQDSKRKFGFLEINTTRSCDRITEALDEEKGKETEQCGPVVQRADTVNSLLQESHFRQKLHIKRKIISEMVNHSAISHYRSSLKQRSFDEDSLCKVIRSGSVFSDRENTNLETNRECDPVVLEQFDSEKRNENKVSQETAGEDYKQLHLLDKGLCLPHSALENSKSRSHRLCYWLTCTYRILPSEDFLHVVVRQTGTLPKLRGKLCAKVFIERGNKAHRIILAESQNDNSFKSHEIFIQTRGKTEVYEKVLVFKLFDQKHVFGKTCIGDWRLQLSDCTEIPKIECEKFCCLSKK